MAWTPPRDWIAGETVTAALMNTHVRDNLKAVGDAWTIYTPTLGNWTRGNGSWDAAYRQAGKLVFFRIKLTLGTTSTTTGGPTFTLPVAATGVRGVVAAASFYDTSAGNPYKSGTAVNNSTTELWLRNGDNSVLSATSPFTWANNDEIVINGAYEAA